MKQKISQEGKTKKKEKQNKPEKVLGGMQNEPEKVLGGMQNKPKIQK